MCIDKNGKDLYSLQVQQQLIKIQVILVELDIFIQ